MLGTNVDDSRAMIIIVRTEMPVIRFTILVLFVILIFSLNLLIPPKRCRVIATSDCKVTVTANKTERCYSSNDQAKLRKIHTCQT